LEKELIMPLLQVDSDIQICELQRCFHLETGLNIEFFDGLMLIDPNLSIYNIWRNRVSNKTYNYSRCRHLSLSSPYSMYCIDSLTKVNEIAQFYKGVFDINTHIIDAKGNAVAEEYRLEEISGYRIIGNNDYRDKLRELNARLMEIESDIKKQWDILNPALQNRIENETDWLCDYEMEFKITYYLDETDPIYIKDRDNIVVIQEKIVSKDDWNELINDGCDYNDRSRKKDEDHDHHCYLLHDLYDHQDVTYKDLSRIGEIWVDYNVTYQHIYEKGKL
jgi:hypothetical protein